MTGMLREVVWMEERLLSVGCLIEKSQALDSSSSKARGYVFTFYPFLQSVY